MFPPRATAPTAFTIGRRDDCDLRLADLSVSRRHAELDRDADGWLLTDLGSRNGTRLNGWLVRETVPVRPGDRLEFGSAIFVITDDAASEPADRACRRTGSAPARVGKRDNGSAGAARPDRDDRPCADRMDARHPAR